MSIESRRLRVVVATPLSDELCARLVELEPRVDLVVDQELLPSIRWPGDHDGDPAFTRTPEQQARYDALVDSAEALYGIPDTSPAALARTVRANPNLLWVHTMAAGGGGQVKAGALTDDELGRIAWSTSAGPHSGPLAEFALFGVLAGAKSLPRLLDQKARKEWSGRWVMRHVYEMTVLVAGLGNIGRGIAARFNALGARVIAVNTTPMDLAYVETVYSPDRLVEAIAEADALVCALPGTDATYKLVNEAVFNACRPGLIVANVGRGTVIDEEALIDALRDGRVGFAALDVFFVEPLPADNPLWEMDNVVIAPHTAALDAAEDRLIAELFAANATRLLDGEPLVNEMNRVAFY